jgi:hypothetical protein
MFMLGLTRFPIGVAVLAHPSLRVFMEALGERDRGSTSEASLVPALDATPTAAAGLSWNVAGGFTASASVNRIIGVRHEARGIGAALRIGYRPGARRSMSSVAPAAILPSSAVTPELSAPPPPPSSPAAAAPRSKHDNSTEATRALNRRAELHPLGPTSSTR